MKSKNEVLRVFNGGFLSNFVEGGQSFFNFFKGGHLKKKFGKPWFNVIKQLLE